MGERREKVSFRDMYEAYFPTVYRVAYTFMKNPADSEDAAHESFLRLMKETGSFRDAEHVKAWLIVTTGNVCRDMLRRKYRGELSLEEAALSLPEDGEKRELLQAVTELPENYKTAVYMYYYEGYSVREIARALGRPGGTVKSWLSRARKILRESLGGEADDGHAIG